MKSVGVTSAGANERGRHFNSKCVDAFSRQENWRRNRGSGKSECRRRSRRIRLHRWTERLWKIDVAEHRRRISQRVEIARALAANPDIIYMDEPFGALDFLTRLKMRTDLVRIWQSEKKTILFVTHDIEEAVQLADRILIMTARPATIQDVVDVDLPRPRHLDSPGYLEKRDRIFQLMGMSLRVGETAA